MGANQGRVHDIFCIVFGKFILHVHRWEALCIEPAIKGRLSLDETFKKIKRSREELREQKKFHSMMHCLSYSLTGILEESSRQSFPLLVLFVAEDAFMLMCTYTTKSPFWHM